MIAVEHLLSIGAVSKTIIIYHSDKDFVTELISNLVPHLVPENELLPSSALLICVIVESATFVWNFLDIFIMIISVGLSTHFELFNHELEEATLEMEVNLRANIIVFLV